MTIYTGRFTVKSLYNSRTVIVMGVSRISPDVPAIPTIIQVIFRDLILFVFVLRSDRRFATDENVVVEEPTRADDALAEPIISTPNRLGSCPPDVTPTKSKKWSDGRKSAGGRVFT